MSETIPDIGTLKAQLQATWLQEISERLRNRMKMVRWKFINYIKVFIL